MKHILIIAAVMLTTVSTAYAQQVPDLTLPDPTGATHSLPQLAKTNGLVLVVTSPTLHSEGAQKGWDKDLVAAKGSSKAIFAMSEEMPDSLFKGTALKEMRKDWKPGDIPLLLVDNAGTLHKALGVAKNQTVVFVFDNTGKLIYKFTGAPTAAQSKTIWGKLK